MEPPLGTSSYRKTDTDVTSDASASRSLVAQTSTESCTTGGLTVEEQPEEAELEEMACPVVADQTLETDNETTTEAALNLMMDSTITLVSNSECDIKEQRLDVTSEDANVQFESPMKKSTKKRFESGTTSIPGKI